MTRFRGSWLLGKDVDAKLLFISQLKARVMSDCTFQSGSTSTLPFKFIVALTAQHHATLPVSYYGLPTLSRVDACDLHRQHCCTFHGRCTWPSATVPSPLPLRESGTSTGNHVIAIIAGFQACIEDRTVSQIVRQRTLVTTAALTLA